MWNMQAEGKKRTWDSTRFRREHMTTWSRSDPVMFPHVQTDHWSKMKTTIPDYFTSVPASLLKDRGTTGSSLLPALTQDEPLVTDVPCRVQTYSLHQNTSPHNMLQYRNVFNDHARRNFCYWLVEKKGSTCKRNSLGAYKTSLGLPKV